ncbi:MAG: LL-diaminopimelate aminotransferase [Deltaproteobacteria bacterium]|nr:LL-diaminopimelate aminotransferase [Deltaproteobacteria bacterium]
MLPAERIRKLPPYLFAEIDRMKKEVAARGVDLISLGIGDPDSPTFPHIVAALQQAATRPANHRYPDYEGMPSFRAAAASYLEKRFAVQVDPATEVVSLIGSKEGIANMAVAFVDPGDIVLVPDPGYPVYSIGTQFNGGTVYPMPLRAENGFLPDLEAIPEEVAKRAKLMWIGYPNNPTGALASRQFFADVVAFADRHGIIVAHDNAYSEIYFDEPPPSFLATPGARDLAIEFHSLSKTYNMTGWRVGFAAGNRALVAGLGKVKTNVDSGIFQAVQEAGIAALTGDQTPVAKMRELYRERRDMILPALASLGLAAQPMRGTFYVWVACPRGFTSTSLVAKLLQDVGVVATPGSGFGAAGEGYIRFSLTVATPRLAEAVERLKTLKL